MKACFAFSFVLVSVLAACAEAEPTVQVAGIQAGGPGVSLLSGAGGSFTCAGRCGSPVAQGTPPYQCFCDDSCVNLGDCCGGAAAYFNVCGCNDGWCGGQHPSGCWCDSGCTGLGDCCPLKVEHCGRG